MMSGNIYRKNSVPREMKNNKFDSQEESQNKNSRTKPGENKMKKTMQNVKMETNRAKEEFNWAKIRKVLGNSVLEGFAAF